MNTKKILAPIDLGDPNKILSGYLYPNIDLENITSFLDITKNKEWEVGMVVFLGKSINKNDLFSKIIDTGKHVPSVSRLIDSIENYFQQLSKFKIGDFVGIKPTEEGFELIKLEKPRVK
jgi:hypothetical protein